MMQRAAILIGVRRTGGLPELRGVDGGLDSMHEWISHQPGFHDNTGKERVVVITDASGAPVLASDVRKAVATFVDDGTIEQLIVYFSGHGANVRYGEYWLLSRAPNDPNEAVNVEGSIPLARECGIPHVILISDACRTAAASIQSQSVTGAVIFPSPDPTATGASGCVDIFYATRVGTPALEVQDANAAGGFHAIYTTGLVAGLNGGAPVVVEEDGGRSHNRIKPWPLKRYLSETIPAMLFSKVGLSATQNPDAIITSAPEAWISEVVLATGLAPAAGGAAPPAPTASAPPHGPGPVFERALPGARAIPPHLPSRARATRTEPRRETLATISAQALREALSGVTGSEVDVRSRKRAVRGLGKASSKRVRIDQLPPQALFDAMLNDVREPGDAEHFESECGFKIHGAEVRSAVAARGRAELLDPGAGLVRLWDVAPPATNVLLQLADGRGTLLPAIRGFITTVAFVGDVLANVWYEPSDNTPLWNASRHELAKLNHLRRVVAAAARLGVFRPDDIEDRERFVTQLRSVKRIDPTMAIYAAFALHSLQQRGTIRQMQGDLRASVGLSLFDIAMLASRPGKLDDGMPKDVFPAVPLLAQGWAFLDAYRIPLPGTLHRNRQLLQSSVSNSLWTLFDRRGVELVHHAITSSEVP